MTLSESLQKLVLKNSNFRFLLLPQLCFYAFNIANAQWLTEYGFRKSIEINESYIPGTTLLVDYHLLVNFTNPNLVQTSPRGYVENINGYDINFTSSDNSTTLDFEIESTLWQKSHLPDLGYLCSW